MLDAETIPFIKYQNNLNKNQLFDQPYKWEQMQSKCSWLAQMLTDKLAPDKTDKTMTCIMAWLLLTFGNICRGFLKKKLTTGKQVTKPLLKNTQQKTYDTPVILNHSSSVRFSPNLLKTLKMGQTIHEESQTSLHFLLFICKYIDFRFLA